MSSLFFFARAGQYSKLVNQKSRSVRARLLFLLCLFNFIAFYFICSGLPPLPPLAEATPPGEKKNLIFYYIEEEEEKTGLGRHNYTASEINRAVKEKQNCRGFFWGEKRE